MDNPIVKFINKIGIFLVENPKHMKLKWTVAEKLNLKKQKNSIFKRGIQKLELPPALNSPKLSGSWLYLKGVREIILELIPDFEEISWTDIDVY